MNALQEQEKAEAKAKIQEEAQADIESRRKATQVALRRKRRFRPEAHRRHRKEPLKHELGEGYEDLPTQQGWLPTDEGFLLSSLDYARLYQVAKLFAIKAKVQDQEDLLHDIILELAEIAKRKLAKGEDFTEQAMIRTAEHIKDRYWHKRYAYYNGLDCRHGIYSFNADFPQLTFDFVPVMDRELAEQRAKKKAEVSMSKPVPRSQNSPGSLFLPWNRPDLTRKCQVTRGERIFSRKIRFNPFLGLLRAWFIVK